MPGWRSATGDCQSAALVSKDGSIDWLCTPRFDSPSLFARILDARSGGHFSIKPAGEFASSSEYIPDTGVLTTSFEAEKGRVVLTDFMLLERGDEPLA